MLYTTSILLHSLLTLVIQALSMHGNSTMHSSGHGRYQHRCECYSRWNYFFIQRLFVIFKQGLFVSVYIYIRIYNLKEKNCDFQKGSVRTKCSLFLSAQYTLALQDWYTSAKLELLHLIATSCTAYSSAIKEQQQ